MTEVLLFIVILIVAGAAITVFIRRELRKSKEFEKEQERLSKAGWERFGEQLMDDIWKARKIPQRLDLLHEADHHLGWCDSCFTEQDAIWHLQGAERA